MEMNQKVKWGVLGCSQLAVNKVIPAIQKLSIVNVIAIASRKSENAEYYSKKLNIERAYGNYMDLIEDESIEAIYIPLPNSLHCKWSAMAAQNGKHVLCEKPAGINPVEVKNVIETCKEHNVLFQEGFMYRFHPQYHRIRQLLLDNAIGEIKLIKASFSFPLDGSQSKIKITKDLGGGCLFDVGCYCINISRWLYNSEPVKVFARANISSQFEVDMSLSAILYFPDAKMATFDCSFEMYRRNTCEIVGSHGKIEIQNAFIPPDHQTRVMIYRRNSKISIEEFPPVNQYSLQFNSFSKCILENLPLDISSIDAYHNTCVLSSLRKSFQNDRPVKVFSHNKSREN